MNIQKLELHIDGNSLGDTAVTLYYSQEEPVDKKEGLVRYEFDNEGVIESAEVLTKTLCFTEEDKQKDDEFYWLNQLSLSELDTLTINQLGKELDLTKVDTIYVQLTNLQIDKPSTDITPQDMQTLLKQDIQTTECDILVKDLGDNNEL